ncbi:hypothetical protein RN001_009595 [Aquatica leii]|uniref:DDE Tnp4 domain-containing protein n=1 Tax=Aquatica leii TaxID=1421715 RepID=A0AAN7P503_9COLE|nr:hypothetical protein RN001_009595 [Aquatica leii]
MIFLNINARYPGTHDAAIWETSTICRNLRDRYQVGERNTYLIGDSGYPIQPWLMTPIPDAAPNSPEAVYTQRHCFARNVVERCFGVLKSRFKCLSKYRVLHYSHRAAGRIIYSCVVLHNLCRKYNIPEIEEDNYNEPQDDDGFLAGDINILTEGRLVRKNLVTLINEMD